MFEAPASEVLGAMITPAFLISASGTLVLSTGNRLGRIVDRVRALTDVAEQMAAEQPTPGVSMDEKRNLITTQLTQLAIRIQLLARVISMLYLAIGLLVATSLAIGFDSFFRWKFSVIPICSGLAGGCMLFYSSMLLVREARLAVTSTLHEMSYVRSIVARHAPRPLREERVIDARP
ncbi:DUF2721 domain-containing protein [Zavarzinella formosa]|uniref:DUF2721 domain-containing protein n=1 Tax=Zavarzinella formosa TaxID=360055 RepID=UPI000307966E|nr:DUF2721 domain-containing protein [Zavarzinella formosa]